MNNYRKSNFIKSAEETVLEFIIAFEENGKTVPKNVIEIKGIPFMSYEAILNDWNRGKIIIQRFAFQYISSVFSVLATPFERNLQLMYTLGTFIAPVIAIILAIFYSWWFIFGIVSPFFFMKWNKSLYNGVIFRSAVQSELIFCFLYYLGQISLTTSDYSTSYYWNKEEPT